MSDPVYLNTNNYNLVSNNPNTTFNKNTFKHLNATRHNKFLINDFLTDIINDNDNTIINYTFNKNKYHLINDLILYISPNISKFDFKIELLNNNISRLYFDSTIYSLLNPNEEFKKINISKMFFRNQNHKLPIISEKDNFSFKITIFEPKLYINQWSMYLQFNAYFLSNEEKNKMKLTPSEILVNTYSLLNITENNTVLPNIPFYHILYSTDSKLFLEKLNASFNESNNNINLVPFDYFNLGNSLLYNKCDDLYLFDECIERTDNWYYPWNSIFTVDHLFSYNNLLLVHPNVMRLNDGIGKLRFSMNPINKSEISNYPLTKINNNSFIEGYWMSNDEFKIIHYNNDKNIDTLYPYPLETNNIDNDFIYELNNLISKCEKKSFLGPSNCRICNQPNGNSEYMFTVNNNSFIFPEGYLHYIKKHGIVPSKEFKMAVLNKNSENFNFENHYGC